jgi:phosphate acyltransferase
VIALDANGADRGAATVAEGGRASGVPVRIFGPAAEIGGPAPDLIDAPVAITNEDEPARAVRARPDASLVQAAKAVGAGDCDGVVSAGPTGALMAASLFHLKRMKGVHRPAAAVLLPVPGSPTLLLDSGANADVRSEYLVQWAYMGSVFMEAVHGVAHPRVGLLSNGSEPKKGTPVVVEAHERLAEGNLNFAGNVEGGDVVSAEIDVVVTDGFTGNVALKLMEGTTRTLVGAIRDAIRSGAVSKLGGLMIRSRLGELRQRLDPETVGGAYLLGLRGLTVVCHGASSRRAIASAIALAQRGVETNVVGKTHAALEEAGVARAPKPDPASVQVDTVR